MDNIQKVLEARSLELQKLIGKHGFQSKKHPDLMTEFDTLKKAEEELVRQQELVTKGDEILKLIMSDVNATLQKTNIQQVGFRLRSIKAKAREENDEKN